MPGYFIHSPTHELFSSPNRIPLIRPLDWEYDLVDMYEVLAFGSEARSRALGAAWEESLLEQELDLGGVWPDDVETSVNNPPYSRPKWHSAQFRMNNMVQAGYWRTLLGRRGFRIRLEAE